MSKLVRIRAADLPRELPCVQALCWEYRDELLALGDDARRVVDMAYPESAWTKLMANLPEKHARPMGSILLVEMDGAVAGCGMIQSLNKNDAEIKRVFIRKSAQGCGAGEKLSRALVEQARADGYRRILLDTTKVSSPARALYEKIGFQQRGPYAEMPDYVLPLMVFYEFNL